MAVIYVAFVLSVVLSFCLFVCLYSGTARESTQNICASCPFDFLVIVWCVLDIKLVYRNWCVRKLRVRHTAVRVVTCIGRSCALSYCYEKLQSVARS